MARLLTSEDCDWPLGRLTGVASFGVPLALWVRGSGSLAELTSTAVILTGARASSAYGKTIVADVGYDLGRVRVTVVSGGGLGVE